MLAAVEFHRELRLPADEIDDEGRFHQLPRERRPKARDPLPNRKLGRCRIVAQLTRSPRKLGINASLHRSHRFRDNSRIAPSSPASVSGYIRSLISSRSIRIDWVYPHCASGIGLSHAAAG